MITSNSDSSVNMISFMIVIMIMNVEQEIDVSDLYATASTHTFAIDIADQCT
jgi:hypothetical protein